MRSSSAIAASLLVASALGCPSGMAGSSGGELRDVFYWYVQIEAIADGIDHTLQPFHTASPHDRAFTVTRRLTP